MTMDEDGGITRCEACGTSQIVFDPPLYFEEAVACGKYVNVRIELLSPNESKLYKMIHGQEKCVNHKGHYPETDHYILIESVYLWRGND